MLEEPQVDAYLKRIGATAPARPGLEGLRHLQERHVLSVPFENLDYHLDRAIHMDEEVLTKVVDEHRGGGCYELNPALYFLLTALGYRVSILPGRVHRPDGIGPAMCHLALRVELEEAWLVDVGFGRNSRRPLRLADRGDQSDPHGTYRLTEAPEGGIDVLLNGRPLYRVDDRPCTLDDFRPTLWWYRTCPDSPFLQDAFCALRTEDGRVTLRGTTLTTIGSQGRTEEELPDESAVLSAYKEHFGFELDRLPDDPAVAGRTAGVQIG